MQNSHSACPKTPPLLAFLQSVRAWYRAWVQMREARYRFLEAILDGTPDPRAASEVRAEPLAESHEGVAAGSDDQRTVEKQDGAS